MIIFISRDSFAGGFEETQLRMRPVVYLYILRLNVIMFRYIPI